MSSLILVNLAMILTDFRAWFSERGFVPASVAPNSMPPVSMTGNVFGLPFEFHVPFLDSIAPHAGDYFPRINLLSGVTDDRITLAFYLIVMAAAFLSALGLWTRLSSIVMAIGIVSLHHRNGFILHGGDTVLRIGALYIAIAPSGKACSLDRLIGLWKGRIQPGPVRVSLWVQRVLAYNTALIYFTTFWHKYGFGTHWRDLTATWYPARLHEFDRFPVPSFFNSLPFVRITTFGTLATELALGTLVFYRPLRKWVLMAGVLMHGYIDYSMNIPLFSFLMVTLYLSFYEGVEIEEWARRLGQRFGRFKATVYLPQRMRFKPEAAFAIDSADPLGLVDFEPGTSPAWEATAKGKPVKPFRASLSRSVGAWPIGAVPYLWKRLLTNSLESSPEQSLEAARPKKDKIRR